MYFLMCSNVHDDVMKFANSWKTLNSEYLENETQFFSLVKENC